MSVPWNLMNVMLDVQNEWFYGLLPQKYIIWTTEEIAPELSLLTGLVEDPRSAPSTHNVPLTTSCNPILGICIFTREHNSALHART